MGVGSTKITGSGATGSSSITNNIAIGNNIALVAGINTITFSPAMPTDTNYGIQITEWNGIPFGRPTPLSKTEFTIYALEATTINYQVTPKA